MKLSILSTFRNNDNHSPRSRVGLSLIEMLVVISIIALLVGITLPAIQKIRESMNRTTCLNHLKQMGLALQEYHNVSGKFPSGVSYQGGNDPLPFMSWLTRLLPHVEQAALWSQTLEAYKQEPDFRLNPPHVGFSRVQPLYVCPSDPSTQQSRTILSVIMAFTDYLGNLGTNLSREDGVLFLDSSIRIAEIRDGTSNTLMAGERPPSPDGILGWWYAGHGQLKTGSAEMVLGAQEYNFFTQAVRGDLSSFLLGNSTMNVTRFISGVCIPEEPTFCLSMARLVSCLIHQNRFYQH
jgi:type II secretory pathway pseudopilin PulG